MGIIKKIFNINKNRIEETIVKDQDALIEGLIGDGEAIPDKPIIHEFDMCVKYSVFSGSGGVGIDVDKIRAPRDQECFLGFSGQPTYRGCKDGVKYQLYYDSDISERYAVIVTFKKLKNLFISGEEFEEFTGNIGKLSCAFLDLENLTIAQWGNCKGINEILAELLDTPIVKISPIMDTFLITDFNSISKIKINANNCEALIGDIEFGDIFKGFEVTKSKSGVLEINGDYQIDFVYRLVSYVDYARQDKVKSISKITITGKINEDTVSVDVYCPKKKENILIKSTESAILKSKELIQLARHVFSVMGDTTISLPEYKNTWDQHLPKDDEE